MNPTSPLPTSAPTHPLPSTPFYSVEYPGYDISPETIPQKLSGLENAFKRSASKEEALVELKLRPDNVFAHPIAGDVVLTHGIVLKVTKRRRKDGRGEYKTEAVGVVSKTVRFRAMADFQFQPDVNDSLYKLRVAMEKMDVEAIRNWRMPPQNFDYMVPMTSSSLYTLPQQDSSSTMNIDPQLTGPVLDPQSVAMDVDIDPELLAEANGALPQPPVPSLDAVRGPVPMKSSLRLFPPPIFSRQTIGHSYNFKSNPTSMVSTIVDEGTGEERKRLINRMRWKGYGPATVAFGDKITPDKPPAAVEEARYQIDEKLLSRLKTLFDERPVWTRASILNQFTHGEAREIINSKILLGSVSYVFQDGPWRDTLVRFGYDPRTELEARFYQRIYFRNANHPINRPSVITRKQERATAAAAAVAGKEDTRRAHIFDGQTVTTETAAFQLCDIEDPLLKSMIEATDGLRESCDDHDGWYTHATLERIKVVLRHKFFAALDGHPASDEECLRLLREDEQERMKKNRSLISAVKYARKPGKHNMAKGALRPEDAAAQRLRATLERNARNFRSNHVTGGGGG